MIQKENILNAYTDLLGEPDRFFQISLDGKTISIFEIIDEEDNLCIHSFFTVGFYNLHIGNSEISFHFEFKKGISQKDPVLRFKKALQQITDIPLKQIENLIFENLIHDNESIYSILVPDETFKGISVNKDSKEIWITLLSLFQINKREKEY